MKKIIEIKYLNQARNSEHYELQEQLLAVITPEFAEKFGINGFRVNYNSAFIKEDEAFLESQALLDTKLVQEKDAARDERLRYIELGVQLKQISLLAADKEAAEKITYVLRPYKDAADKPYSENTALVRDLVKKVRSATYASAIQQLGLTDAVAALEEANEAFNVVYSRRSDEKQARAGLDALKVIRPKVDEAFRQLAEAISALYLVTEMIEHNATKAAEIALVVDGANARILQFSETLSRRGAGAKAKLEPGTDPGINPGENQGGDDRPEEI